MQARYFFFLFFILLTRPVFYQADKTITLVFHPMYGNTELKLDSTFYKIGKSDSLQIETLKFYISGIELYTSEKPAWKEKNSYHLVDASDKRSLCISLQVPGNISFTKLKMNLGIDSLTNVSGALEGDLDPTKGMYWTWQSGYINFKLEGKSNLCKTRNNAFQFHFGGYLSPNYSMQKISLDIKPKEVLDVYLDIQKFIAGVPLANQNQIMSPCKEAVVLSEKVSQNFSNGKR